MPSQKGHSRDDHEGQGYHHEDPEIRLLSLILAEVGRTNDILQRGSCSDVATKQDLARMECRIMSAIGDWSAKVGPKLDRIQTGLDTVQALVEQLQNSPGAITPEDQALLDQIEQKVDAIAADADSVPATPPPA